MYFYIYIFTCNHLQPFKVQTLPNLLTYCLPTYLSICMYLYIYVYMYVFMFIFIYIYLQSSAVILSSDPPQPIDLMFAYLFIYMYIFLYMYICMYVFMFIFVYLPAITCSHFKFRPSPTY